MQYSVHAVAVRRVVAALLSASLGAGFLGCEEEAAGGAPTEQPDVGASTAPTRDLGPGPGAQTGGDPRPALDAAAPGPAPVDTPDAAPPFDPANPSGLPCAVTTVLTARCTSCHAESPRFGAPMPLVTLDDLRAPSRDDPTRPVHDLVIERMLDERRTMPPPPQPPADEAEIAVLRAWVDAGAPAGEACQGDDVPPPPMDVGVDIDAPLPPPHEDCDYVFELRAHGVGVPDDETPYSVPPLTDLYVNFTFSVPWTGSVHGLSFHPIVDDERVLHHMLLYSHPVGGNLLNGTIVPGIGAHPGESLVAGWAPGGTPSIMPEGVGMELPPGPTGRFVLEVHYHNEAGYLDALDRSGFRVCATSKKREQTAAVHLLGTELLAMAGPGEFQFTGVCHPWLNLSGIFNREPVTIVSSSPHLHQRGRRLTTKIHRVDGTTDILIDVPFDWDNQIIHPTPATIYPGDWLETTCYYENDGGIATFGVRTEDEMCQNYILAYPVGALDTGGSLILEAHACML